MVNKYSVIIPYFQLAKCQDRLAAYEFVVARVADSQYVNEVLIAVQGDECPPVCSNPKVHVINYPDDGIEIRKSWLYNQTVLQCRNQRILLLDADVWLPFDKVFAELEHGPLFVCKPFSEIIKLGSEQTRQFITERKVQPTRQKPINVLCGGAVIFDKSIFMYLRGFDERITGWGLEDSELGQRVKHIFHVRNLNNRGLHLYHPTAQNIPAAIDKYGGIYRASRDTINAYMHLQHVVSSIPYRWEYQELPKMAVVIAVFGTPTSDQYFCNMVVALHEFMRWQKYRAPVYFYATTDQYAKVCEELGIIHVFVPSTEHNVYLFQKESLYNLAMTQIDAEQFVFMDLDAMPMDPEWLKKISDILEQDPIAAVQCYNFFADLAADKKACSFAYGYTKSGGIPSEVFEGEYLQPGLVWAFNAEYIRKHKFNPWHLTGGGDTAFVCEYCKVDTYKFAFTRRYFKQLHRTNIPHGNVYCVHTPVMHAYHGSYVTRAYNWSKELLDCFGELRQFIHIDAAGLLAWNDLNNPLRYSLMRKPELQNEQTLMKVVMESIAKTRKVKDV